MAREEAIRRMECCRNFLANNYSDMGEPNFTAFNIAIKALEQEPKTDDFAKWVAREIFDDNWEYNKDAFAEIACRKLAKLGIVIAKGDEWELVEQESCDTCEHSDEIDGSNCYECVKGIRDRYNPQPCPDAINRQAVLEIQAKYAEHVGATKFWQMRDDIKALPSVNSQQKIGHWIDADGDNAICGCCNRLNHLYGIYCKHCGAKMVEPQESEG